MNASLTATAFKSLKRYSLVDVCFLYSREEVALVLVLSYTPHFDFYSCPAKSLVPCDKEEK